MGIARSAYYSEAKGSADDTALVEAMHAIKDEFEAYGWRRMQAALRHRGWIVNHKKIKRRMREHALHPPRRRRFVATTDSDHDEPVFPDRSRGREIDGPNPPPGCIHHSDRGSQYAAQAYRALLSEHGLVGSMARRGNPYDNAMMESFMKTLKVEGVYPMAFESEEDVACHLPRFIDSYNERRLHSALGYLSPNRFEEEQLRKPGKSAA